MLRLAGLILTAFVGTMWLTSPAAADPLALRCKQTWFLQSFGNLGHASIIDVFVAFNLRTVKLVIDGNE